MSEVTQNLNLIKPAGLERFNLNDWNENMDKIDVAVHTRAKIIEMDALPTTDIKEYPIIYAIPQEDNNTLILWRYKNGEWGRYGGSEGGNVKAVDLTQAQYDALDPSEKNKDIIYFITDGDGGSGASTAKNVSYDNSESKMNSDNVQDAITELKESIKSITNGSIIYVTTGESSLTLKEVTATCGDHTATAKFNIAGKATLNCPWSGETTITSTDGTDTATGTIVLGAFSAYEITISFYELYGFRKKISNSDPSSRIEYLSDCDNANFTPAKMNFTTGKFEYGPWENVFFIKNLKPCMLKYDGTVDYELDKNDYTKKLDGTASDVTNTSYAGNAMMGFPTVWVKTFTQEGYQYAYICSKQLDSSYKAYAHMDSNANIMPYTYMRIYEGSLINSKIRSLSGQSLMNSQTASNEVTYAKANNLSGSTIWYTGVLADWLLLNILLTLIGKSTDSQATFGNGNIYYQNNTSGSFINTGTMNDKGLFYGSNSTTTHVGVKVFGIENPWGNIWERIAGWINANGTQKIKLTYGTQDGSTVTGYNLDGSGYVALSGATPSGTNGGYISSTITIDYGMIPVTASGSATTYECDGLWFNNSQVNYALVGGHVSSSLLCGASCSNLNDAASDSYWDVGASLSCKPSV